MKINKQIFDNYRRIYVTNRLQYLKVGDRVALVSRKINRVTGEVSYDKSYNVLVTDLSVTGKLYQDVPPMKLIDNNGRVCYWRYPNIDPYTKPRYDVTFDAGGNKLFKLGFNNNGYLESNYQNQDLITILIRYDKFYKLLDRKLEASQITEMQQELRRLDNATLFIYPEGDEEVK